jgi:hypothetical protein
MESTDKTVGSVVQFFEKLITDFSWRRLGFVAGLIVLVGSTLVVYEYYTQTLKLNRLNQETALLERVAALDRSLKGDADENLTASVESLKARLRHVGRQESGGTLIPNALLKALYTAIPWVMMSILIIVSPGSGASAAILGMALFAIPLAVLNVNLPDFQPNWINRWLVPWGEAVFVILAILAWQKRGK